MQKLQAGSKCDHGRAQNCDSIEQRERFEHCDSQSWRSKRLIGTSFVGLSCNRVKFCFDIFISDRCDHEHSLFMIGLKLNIPGSLMLWAIRSFLISGLFPDRHLRNVQISGLQSSDFLLYKVKPSAERISNYSLSGSSPFTLTFCDTVGPQEQYVILPQSRVYSPVFKTIKNFSGLRSNKSQTDYIAITHPKFYPEAV